MPTEGRILTPADVSGGNPVRTIVQSTTANDEALASSKDVQVLALTDPDTPTSLAKVTDGGLGVNGGAPVSLSGAIGVGLTGTVGPLSVAAQDSVTFNVANTVAASAWGGAPVLVFEQSGDGTSWGPLTVVRNDTGHPGSTFKLGPGAENAALQFDGDVHAIGDVCVPVPDEQSEQLPDVSSPDRQPPRPRGLRLVVVAPLRG